MASSHSVGCGSACPVASAAVPAAVGCRVVPVLLAGGVGSRLWPLSREHYPKQFLHFVEGEGSLFEDAVQRLVTLAAKCPDMGVGPSVVVCNEEHRFLLQEQLRLARKFLRNKLSESPALAAQAEVVFPEDGVAVVLEPDGRNTAPALTAVALTQLSKGVDPVLLVFPSDHVLMDVKGTFAKVVSEAVKLAHSGRVVTIGVQATQPVVSYGYIHRGEPLQCSQEGLRAFGLQSFTEKPSLEFATKFVQSGEYLWNTGVFVVRASVWSRALQRLRPIIYSAIDESIKKRTVDGVFIRPDRKAWERCPTDSIDYSVMEKLGRTGPDGKPLCPEIQGATVELQMGWYDVASWAQFAEVTHRDAQGNVCNGDVMLLNTDHSLVLAKHRLVAAVGCSDMVIVETADAVLVVPKKSTQDVGELVKQLKASKRSEAVEQRRVYRPWGNYEGLDMGARYQVKRLVVNPGQKLSLQLHYHRAEHWIVVSGTAMVTRGNDKFVLTENQSTFISIGEKHRLENPGSIPLEVIEVQSGSYVGEDDIVRFEDVYNRCGSTGPGPVAVAATSSSSSSATTTAAAEAPVPLPSITPYSPVAPPRLSFPVTPVRNPLREGIASHDNSPSAADAISRLRPMSSPSPSP
eukprot:RCo039706